MAPSQEISLLERYLQNTIIHLHIIGVISLYIVTSQEQGGNVKGDINTTEIKREWTDQLKKNDYLVLEKERVDAIVIDLTKHGPVASSIFFKDLRSVIAFPFFKIGEDHDITAICLLSIKYVWDEAVKTLQKPIGLVKINSPYLVSAPRNNN